VICFTVKTTNGFLIKQILIQFVFGWTKIGPPIRFTITVVISVPLFTVDCNEGTSGGELLDHVNFLGGVVNPIVDFGGSLAGSFLFFRKTADKAQAAPKPSGFCFAGTKFFQFCAKVFELARLGVTRVGVGIHASPPEAF